MAKIFNQLTDQISQLEREIHHLEARDQADLDADQVINAALSAIDSLPDLARDSSDFGVAANLFQAVNLNLFLAFRQEQQKKRIVNRVARGVVTLGSAPPPIKQYNGATSRHILKNQAAAFAAPSEHGDACTGGSLSDEEEENSLGNVNRGDSRLPFVNEIAGVALARSLFPQTLEFTGDAVLQLVEPGLYTKRRNH